MIPSALRYSLKLGWKRKDCHPFILSAYLAFEFMIIVLEKETNMTSKESGGKKSIFPVRKNKLKK